MKRREFIAGLSCAAAAWPLAAHAQPTDRARLIGVLMASKQDDPVSEGRLTAFRNGLVELGWTEGHNIRFEVRYVGGDPDRARVGA